MVVAALLLAPTAAPAGEVTGAADNLRTGWYPDEPALAPSLVTKERFKQAFEVGLKGQIYAQPLVANGTLLVVTEENFAYGLDPVSGAKRWEDHLGLGTAVEAGSGKTINCGDLNPFVGITGTPVIDTERNVAYFVSNRYRSGGSGPIAWYMHAVKLDNGEEIPNFPVEIKGSADNVEGTEFQPVQELQRPALLMTNGFVYAAFGSHCDSEPYEGWIVGVSASQGAKAHVVKFATTAVHGASVWQSGGGLVSDGEGRIFFSTGNNAGGVGLGDPTPGTTPQEGSLAESVVRAQVQSDGSLKAADFFSPFNNRELDASDFDLGSSAPVALPSQFKTANVAAPLVQAGKVGTIYVLNREHLGGMGASENHVVQEIPSEGGVWGAASLWPGEGGRYVYMPSVSPGGTAEESHNRLRFYRYEEVGGNPHLSVAARTPESEPLWFGSGSPIVTSNGTQSGSGLVWMNWCPVEKCTGAKLRAFAAVPSSAEPKPLWEGAIGSAAKFTRPDASNGHIYVGNREGHVMSFSGPALSPSAEAVRLGATLTGRQLTGQVTFTNTGTPLKITGVKAPSAPFTVTGLPSTGTTIAPGQGVTAGVTFNSATPGSFEQRLVLEAEGGFKIEVPVSASAEATRLSLTPSTGTLELGSTPPGGQLSGEVAFTNTGNSPLTVAAVQPPSGPFQASGLPQPGTEIAPGQAVVVRVSFSPSSPGVFGSSIGVSTQAGTTSITLSGSSEAPPEPVATVTTASFLTSGGGPGLEQLLDLTELRLRSYASRLASHHRRLVVSFLLSGAGRVQALVYRRVTSHHCRAGVSSCGRWAQTRIGLKVSARAGSNLLAMQLGTIPAGNYRLALTPIAPSGTRGATRYLQFKTYH